MQCPDKVVVLFAASVVEQRAMLYDLLKKRQDDFLGSVLCRSAAALNGQFQNIEGCTAICCSISL